MTHQKPTWQFVAVILFTGLIGALVLSQAVLGNITANVLQERLGERTWMAVVAFVIVTVLIAALVLGQFLLHRRQPIDPSADPEEEDESAAEATAITPAAP